MKDQEDKGYEPSAEEVLWNSSPAQLRICVPETNVQVSLAEALRTRKPLKPVAEEHRPAFIGGKKGPSQTKFESPLRKELLERAFQVHERLGPRLVELNLKKEAREENEVLQQLKGVFNAPSGNIFKSKSPLRPKYELDRIVQEFPGWLTLQHELRMTKRAEILKPVEIEGFYIIREHTVV